MSDDAQRAVHAALGGMLDDDEFALSWVLTIEVAGPDGRRYLAHRAGGGADGTEAPMAWSALGMLRASAQVAERQLADTTVETEEDEDE